MSQETKKTITVTDSCKEKLDDQCPKPQTYSDFIEEMLDSKGAKK
jgi:predicted CopG family antitoxin